VQISISRRWGVFLLNGALALTAGTGRGLAQSLHGVDATPDSYSQPLLRAPKSVFDPIRGLGAKALPLNGKFEVPWELRAVPGSTSNKISGATRYEAFDGQRLILLLHAVAEKVLYAPHARDAVLTIQPDPSNANRLKYTGRVVNNATDSLIAEVAAMPSLDDQITKLLSALPGEQLDHVPKKFEGTLEIGSMSADGAELYPLDDKNRRKSDPVKLKIISESGSKQLEITYKGYRLAIELPR
jgi:hypothetical protein